MVKRSLSSSKAITRSEKKAKKPLSKKLDIENDTEAKMDIAHFEDPPKFIKNDVEDLLNIDTSYYEAIRFKESQLFSSQQKGLLNVFKLLSDANSKFPSGASLATADKFLFQNSKIENTFEFAGGVGKDYLSYVMTWKLLRGKIRPRLLKLVGENTEDLVKEVTKSCFSELHALVKDFKALPEQDESFISMNKSTILKLVKDLSILRGVGPATASALLSMLCFEIPFMSDEGLFQMLNKNPTKYDLKTYDKYLDFVDSQAKKVLSKRGNLQPGEYPLAFVLERSWFSKMVLEKKVSH